MTYTLDYLKANQNKPLKFTLNFKDEAKELVMVEDIATCYVEGTYKFKNNRYLNFTLNVKAEVTLLAADTLNPIKHLVQFTLIDEVSDNFQTEYKINNNQIDFYDLVWGWFITEIPYRIFERD